jgi:hypothetical protein
MQPFWELTQNNLVIIWNFCKLRRNVREKMHNFCFTKGYFLGLTLNFRKWTRNFRELKRNFGMFTET